MFEEGGERHRARRFHHQLRVLPEEPHGREDGLLRDGQNVFDLAPNDREVPHPKRGAEPVRDGVRRLDGEDPTGAERSHRVVRPRRLRSEHPASPLRPDQRASAEQAAATDRDQERVHRPRERLAPRGGPRLVD